MYERTSPGPEKVALITQVFYEDDMGGQRGQKGI